jgi:hypothetical protein
MLPLILLLAAQNGPSEPSAERCRALGDRFVVLSLRAASTIDKAEASMRERGTLNEKAQAGWAQMRERVARDLEHARELQSRFVRARPSQAVTNEVEVLGFDDLDPLVEACLAFGG